MSESATARAGGDVLVSVMVCTWNPRRDVLSRVLDALARQTLSPEAWELLIVDNGSVPPVETPAFPGASIRCRLVVEPVADVTAARIRGVREARGPLIVSARARVQLRTWMSWLGLKHRGPARAIDLAYHRGFLEGARHGGR